jgi:hypothetical protein
MTERGRGRGRRGGRTSFLSTIAKEMNTTPSKLWKMNPGYEPEPTFPHFTIPRPTKLSQEETNAVKYYKNLHRKIMEETPFYVGPRKRAAEEDEDDGKICLCVRLTDRDCSVSR